MFPELEKICDKCQGKAKACYYCGFSGKVPSEFGQKLLYFIYEYNPFRNDMDTLKDRIRDVKNYGTYYD